MRSLYGIGTSTIVSIWRRAYSPDRRQVEPSGKGYRLGRIDFLKIRIPLANP